MTGAAHDLSKKNKIKSRNMRRVVTAEDGLAPGAAAIDWELPGTPGKLTYCPQGHPTPHLASTTLDTSPHAKPGPTQAVSPGCRLHLACT